MDNLKAQRVSVAMHTAFGIIAGYLSLYFSRALYSLGVAIILLLAAGVLAQKTFGKGKDRKWWLGNGAIIYILMWIVSWIILFNFVQPQAKLI